MYATAMHSIEVSNEYYWDQIISAMEDVVHKPNGTAYRIGKDAKYKIVFYKPPPNENSNIPKKFQGVQYYTTKSEADLALKDRLKLSEKLKIKKSQDIAPSNILGGINCKSSSNHP